MTHNEKYTMAKGILIGCFVTLGVWIGFFISEKKEPEKKYSIEVQTYWTSDGFQSYPKMDADSLRGDTIFRDGNYIINKNIINVVFK